MIIMSIVHKQFSYCIAISISPARKNKRPKSPKPEKKNNQIFKATSRIYRAPFCVQVSDDGRASYGFKCTVNHRITQVGKDKADQQTQHSLALAELTIPGLPNRPNLLRY